MLDMVAADSVMGKAEAHSALVLRLRKVEALAETERDAIHAQQQALTALQQEQFNLAVREDALEARQAAKDTPAKTKAAGAKTVGKAKKSFLRRLFR